LGICATTLSLARRLGGADLAGATMPSSIDTERGVPTCPP
jgi:hypothetical protein